MTIKLKSADSHFTTFNLSYRFAHESQVDVLWRWMVSIWNALVHFFSGSWQIIKSFNRANNHKRLQLCALLKFFDNVIQSYFFFPVYKTFTTLYPRHCTQTGVHLNYGKSPSAGEKSHAVRMQLISRLSFVTLTGLLYNQTWGNPRSINKGWNYNHSTSILTYYHVMNVLFGRR